MHIFHLNENFLPCVHTTSDKLFIFLILLFWNFWPISMFCPTMQLIILITNWTKKPLDHCRSPVIWLSQEVFLQKKPSLFLDLTEDHRGVKPPSWIILLVMGHSTLSRWIYLYPGDFRQWGTQPLVIQSLFIGQSKDELYHYKRQAFVLNWNNLWASILNSSLYRLFIQNTHLIPPHSLTNLTLIFYSHYLCSLTWKLVSLFDIFWLLFNNLFTSFSCLF